MIYRMLYKTFQSLVERSIINHVVHNKPRTGRTGPCMNHAPAILAALALIYGTHGVLVVWIILAHFHLCSLRGTLSRYTVLEV